MQPCNHSVKNVCGCINVCKGLNPIAVKLMNSITFMNPEKSPLV